MTAPGTIVNVTSSASANAAPSSTGTFFAVGQAASGPVGTPVLITSLAQYISVFGGRTVNGVTQTLYDAVDAFFQEGGQQVWVSRVFLAADVTSDTANLTLDDRAGSPLATLKVSAIGPGAYGNAFTVAVANGTVENTFVLTIDGGAYGTEISPGLTSPADAVNWATNYSKLVAISNLGSGTAAPNNNPAVISATALSGGADNTSPADADFEAALAVFTLDLGMGQVAAPGRTTDAVWEALINHAQSFNRYALLDAENTATAGSIEADAVAVQGATSSPDYGVMLAPYPLYPGLPTTTATPPYPRTVAPSGPAAGVMAASAAAGNNADVEVAGQNGILAHAIGVSQTYSDSDRAALDAAGVCVIRNYKRVVQLYGITGLATDPNWVDIGNCRLRMQIIDAVRNIGDQFMFGDIDANGHLASAFNGAISSVLSSLWTQNALYGATPADAFSVNTGPNLNTPEVAAERELLAQVAVVMAPGADQVIINVTKYPVGQPLPG